MRTWVNSSEPGKKFRKYEETRQSTSRFGALKKVFWALALAFLTGLGYSYGQDAYAAIRNLVSPVSLIVFESHVAGSGEFTSPKGCIQAQGNIVSLEAGCEYGHFLSKESFQEDSTIEFSIAPKSEKLNFFLIVEDVFQLFIGDGDRRAVALKIKYPDGVWRPWRPEGLPESSQDRVYLATDLIPDNAVIGVVKMGAKPNAGGQRKVQLLLTFYDADGRKIETKKVGPEMKWEFTLTTAFNSMRKIGYGLSDPGALSKPTFRFDWLKITTTEK